MKTNKKHGLKAIFAAVPAILLGVSVFAASVSLASAIVLTIDENYYFIYTDNNNHQFKCYEILNGDPEHPAVSIAWLKDDANNPYPAATLDIPQTVSDGTTTYTVESIAKAGFRGCTSTAITVPNTVLEIKEEAFAYCQNITDFTFPYSLDEIAPSTFLDCRNLETLAYRDSSGNRSITNETIEKIGDHAFDSCVKLKNFYCPTSVTEFGHSCFQKCESIVNFFFPVKNADINNYTNQITIRSYAFADCSLMNYVYFEENMYKVEHHAFADCNLSLVIHYTGSSDPSYDSHWRDVYITPAKSDLIPIVNSENEIRSDISYPGLYYTTETADIKLDSAVDNSTQVYFTQNAPYAQIYKFDAPFESVPGYYDVSTGALTLPNTIDGKPLKVINENTFQNNLDLTSVKFNADLVQIKHNAFYHCTNIASLDFSSCTALKEISYDVFQDPIKPEGNEVYNQVLTEIHLPACLEYIGDFAFYNFLALSGSNAITFGGSSSQLKVLGAYAFAVNRNKTYSASGSIDVVLPCSLNDAAAQAANYKHIHNGMDSSRYIDIAYCRPYAIGTHCFDNLKALRSAAMAECTHSAHINDNTYTTSIASNTFVRCENLFRFKANQNLCYIGKDCFKSIKLKELFLCSEKAEASATFKFPWAVEDNQDRYGETLFWGTETENAVIYVTGSKAPKSNDSMVASDSTYENSGNYWNSNNGIKNGTYRNELGTGDDNSIRTRVPTFYNVDYFSSGSIVYWKPNSSGGGSIVSEPTQLSDYDNGLVSFVKDSVTGKYTVGRYYCTSNTKVDEINLTNITGVSTDLVGIGDEAFGSTTIANGYYFILPNTVTKIQERAFYRSSAGNGVRIVTYSDNGTIAVPSHLSGSTYATIKSTVNNSNGNPYLCMPTGLTTIEKSAFYNAKFKSIDLSSSLSFIGNAAFYNHASISIAAINGDFAANSDFEKSNNGIYYDNGTDRFLVYQTANLTGTLTIDEGTTAIAMRAVTHTNYTKITLPSTLKTIYGGAFQKNDAVTEIDGAGVSSVKYICTMLENDQQPFDNAEEGLYFDNLDYRRIKNDANRVKFSRRDAFRGCSNLVKLNFRAMTSLKYLGTSAFADCKKLEDVAGGQTYTFYECTHSTNTSSGGTTTVNATATYSSSLGVLDLTNCTSLLSVAGGAFSSTDALKYVITPDTNPSVTRNANGVRIGESRIKFGINGSEAATGSAFSGKKIIVGETISQAWPGYNVGGINNNIGSHYNSNSFSGNTVYYYAEYKSDVTQSAWTGVKYWTKDGSGNYILFDNGYQAYDYLPAYTA